MLPTRADRLATIERARRGSKRWVCLMTRAGPVALTAKVWGELGGVEITQVLLGAPFRRALVVEDAAGVDDQIERSVRGADQGGHVADRLLVGQIERGRGQGDRDSGRGGR